MLFAKPASPPKAVANARLAPGATSWTICSIARPSSELEFCPHEDSCTTITVGGRSPVAMSNVAPPWQL